MLNLGQRRPFVVEDIERRFRRHRDIDFAGPATYAFFLNAAQNMQRCRFRGPPDAATAAMEADVGGGFRKAGPEPLTGKLQQTEGAYPADLNAGPVAPHGFFQPPFNRRLVAVDVHVDKVDHHETGQIPQPHLTGNFGRCFQVGLERGFLNVPAPGRTPGVHINSHQRLGRIDHDIAARFELHFLAVHGFKLGFNPVPGEQRNRVVLIRLHFLGMTGHQNLHQVLGHAVAFVAFDEYLTNIFAVGVSERPLDDVGFLMDEGGGGGFQCQVSNIGPQPDEVFEVPFDFSFAAIRAGGADNDRHTVRDRQIGDHGFQPLAVCAATDLSGNAAAFAGVRHKHTVPSRER